MAERQLTCAHCGAQFTTSHKRKYCTRTCVNAKKSEARRVRLGRERRWPDGKPEPLSECKCIVCGKAFTPRARDRMKCCGRECGLLLSGTVAAARKNGARVYVTMNRAKCPNCGRRHNGLLGSYCCDECRAETNRKKARIYAEARHQAEVATCRECSAQFVKQYGDKLRFFCSIQCAAKSARRVAKKSRDKRIRQSALRQAVNPTKVFDRDGWRCKMCGCKTPMAARGSMKPNAPELDHIMPLSLGGDHSYANTQCLCRKCNGSKGATPMGQLMLFPDAA